MSEDPPNSSGIPGRHRPALSDLSKETTEDDLWNLDDDEPRPDFYAPKPPPDKKSPAPKAGGGLPEGEPQSRNREEVSTPPKSGRHDPLADLRGRQGPVDEIGDLDESEEQIVTLETPESHQRKAAPATVEDQLEAPVTVPTPVEEAPAPAPAPVEEVGPAPVEDTQSVPTPEAPPVRTVETASKAVQRKPLRTFRRGLNRREVIGLAAFAFVMIAVALWVITRFFSQLPFKSEFIEKPDFPVKGEYAVLEAAEGFWREPVRSGPDRDVARREVVMIPALEIKLARDGSAAGALRIIFRNSDGESIGDPITRSFSGGSFDASGSPSLEFPSTDGFLEMGSFNAYRTGKDNPWRAEILEGPSVDAPASSFKPLTPVPLFPLRR
jgi:hypothetical protein